MAPSGTKQVVHRPGPLKQSNKPHKGGKGKGHKHVKGKLDVKASSHRNKQNLNKQDRKNQLIQIRKFKRDEVIKRKRLLNGFDPPPIITTVLAIDDKFNTDEFLDRLKVSDETLQISQSSLGYCHISSFRFKQRYTFLTPSKTELHSVMDALKVSEVLILLHSVNVCDDYTNMLQSVILNHSLPTTLHVVQGINAKSLNTKQKNEMRKNVLKKIESRFPDAKLHCADSSTELQLLLRQIGNQKQRPVGFRDNRFHMLVEEMSFQPSETDAQVGTLEVSGYVRGQKLDVNSLVHLPGWGTYQMQAAVICSVDPHSTRKSHGELALNVKIESDPIRQESLQSEVEPNPMDGEQTWPTQEELNEADLQPKKTVRKVAEGISDYQASWIVDSEPEDSSSEDEEIQPMEQDEDEEDSGDDHLIDDTLSSVGVQDDKYDNDIDMDEEKKTLVRFKEERTNQMFPDEIDTPMDVSARVRFQKYRGLKNFASSPWDPMENLPSDYARIFRFQNFKQTKKRALSKKKEESNEESNMELGDYV